MLFYMSQNIRLLGCGGGDSLGSGCGRLRVADQSQCRGVDLCDARLRAGWADGAEQLSSDRGRAVDTRGVWDVGWDDFSKFVGFEEDDCFIDQMMDALYISIWMQYVDHEMMFFMVRNK